MLYLNASTKEEGVISTLIAYMCVFAWHPAYIGHTACSKPYPWPEIYVPGYGTVNRGIHLRR